LAAAAAAGARQEVLARVFQALRQQLQLFVRGAQAVELLH